MRLRARAGDHLHSPVFLAGELKAQQDAGRECKYRIVFRGRDKRRPPAVALQARDHGWKIIGLDDKREFLDDLRPAPDFANHFDPLRVAGTEKEFLDGGLKIVRTVEQHRMSLGQALLDMLGHAQAEDFLNLAAVEFFAQFINGGDAELLVNPLDTLGIKARMRIYARDRRRSLRSQRFQFPQAARLDDFPDGGSDGVTDAGILR